MTGIKGEGSSENYWEHLKEVVMMKLLNPFEAGGDIDGLEDLILGEPFGDLFMSRWKDKIINKIGEDEITKALLNKMGKKKLLELLDKLDRDLQD